MSLAELRSAIAGSMKDKFPAINVAEHGGPINRGEIEKWATGAPAIRVCCLGVPQTPVNGGVIYLDAAWAAFCIEKDRPGVKGNRDVRVLLLVQSALSYIAKFGQTWNGKAASTVDALNAVNLYARDIDDMGVALWAVRWRQAVKVPEDVDVTQLDDFRTFFASWPLAPLDADGNPVSKSPVTQQQIEVPGPEETP